MGDENKSKLSVALPVSMTFAGGVTATVVGVSVLGKLVEAAFRSTSAQGQGQAPGRAAPDGPQHDVVRPHRMEPHLPRRAPPL